MVSESLRPCFLQAGSEPRTYISVRMTMQLVIPRGDRSKIFSYTHPGEAWLDT